MEIPIADAAERLDELVDRALAGEDVILTRSGEPALKIISWTDEGDKRGDSSS